MTRDELERDPTYRSIRDAFLCELRGISTDFVPTNTGKPWSPEDIQTLRALYERGEPRNAIGDHLRRSRTSVDEAIKRFRITREEAA